MLSASHGAPQDHVSRGDLPDGDAALELRAGEPDGVRPLECLHVLRPLARGHPRFCVHRSSLLPSLKGEPFLGLNVRVQRNGSGALA